MHLYPAYAREAHAMQTKGDPSPPLEVTVSPTSDSQFFAGLSGDARRGGVFVATYRPFVIGSPITLTIQLPGGVVVASGIVTFQHFGMQTAAAGVGIKFDGRILRGAEMIDEFCRRTPPLYVDEGMLASCA
jgi:hypothetical protein